MNDERGSGVADKDPDCTCPTCGEESKHGDECMQCRVARAEAQEER